MHILSIYLLFHFDIYQSSYISKDKNLKKRKALWTLRLLGEQQRPWGETVSGKSLHPAPSLHVEMLNPELFCPHRQSGFTHELITSRLSFSAVRSGLGPSESHCLNLSGTCRRDICKVIEDTIGACRKRYRCCRAWWVLIPVPTPSIYSDYQEPLKPRVKWNEAKEASKGTLLASNIRIYISWCIPTLWSTFIFLCH